MSGLKKYYFGKKQNEIDLINGLVAYYAFEDNLNDQINANTGIGTNITFVNAKVNRGMRDSGVTAYLDIPNSSNLDFSNTTNDLPFSISFWFWRNDSATRCVLNKRGGTASNDQYMINVAATVIQVYLYSNSTSDYLLRFVDITPIVMPNNTWNHISITYDGSGASSGIKIYFNGVLKTTTDGSVGIYTKMPISNQVNRIGRLYNNTFTAGAMQLDELAIWKNRELKQAEVTYLYNSGSGRTYPF